MCSYFLHIALQFQIPQSFLHTTLDTTNDCFRICLSEADIIQPLVRVVIEALLLFLGAPIWNAMPAKPLHNEGRFPRNSADTVKQEYTALYFLSPATISRLFMYLLMTCFLYKRNVQYPKDRPPLIASKNQSLSGFRIDGCLN